MSDFMLLGILRMPIEADSNAVAFTQFRSSAREAANRIEALTAERDARIDPAEVQALVNAAEPMLATALAAAEAERDRLRAVLEAIVDEYNGQVHGPIIYSIADAHAALKGETP